MKGWLDWFLAAVRAAGWAPIAVFSAHVVASRVVGAYLLFPSLDVPMHLFGGAAIAYFFQSSLRLQESESVVGVLTATAASLLSIAATGTTTLFWEFAEWLADQFFGTQMQRGLNDTLLDMSLGVVGGLVLIGLATAQLRQRKRDETPEGRSTS